MRIGYFLSCEEYTPAQLIEQARLAQDAGFQGLWISDHFHPRNDAQGQSPFVWSIIGALSQAVTIPVTTAVTCPIMRIHPALIAQAAATSAVLHDGRFMLGVGTGEALNEHITGERWPFAEERLDTLEEAVEVARRHRVLRRPGSRERLRRTAGRVRADPVREHQPSSRYHPASPTPQAIMVSDIFPTAWFGAKLAEIRTGDTVAVFGAGPVGQLTILSAYLQGAGWVVAVDHDHDTDRLAVAQA